MPPPRTVGTVIDRASHTILVVDDNPSTRYSTQRILRAAGFQTKEATTGGEGLALAPTGISAVVLDVHLPDIDGFEVCAEIRAHADTALLPVVHLSGTYVENEDKVAGLNAGADGYLVHPVEPSVLIATLQALIRARMAEDRLRRSDLRFRAIYNHAESGMALIDAEGRFADVNPAIMRLLGRSREELVECRVSAFASEEWRPFIEQHLTGLPVEAPPWKGEFPLVKSDGSSIDLDWNMSAHVEAGLRVGVAVDASERIQLERRRQEVLEREQAARVVAERHSRTKDDFIAVLSHELRTLLNAITGWVHILAQRGLPPDMVKGIDAIARNAKAQARIIADILDASRINSGKLRIERELSNPVELITLAIASLQQSIDAKQLTIDTSFNGASTPAWLDPTRFQQILWNLLTNAIKFSSKGGTIQVALQRAGDELTLVVRDFGQGISPEFLEQLFDRFTQSDAPGNRYHGGLGLGLSIVKHLAELHSGRVAAESEGPGHGATMKVVLLVAPASEPGEVSASSKRDSIHPDQSRADSSLTGLDVLVVEDDPDAMELIGVVLSDRGVRVRTAAHFEGAIEAVIQAWPDVLVSDIGLPGRDGYELIRELRKRAAEEGRTLRSIALTAFSRPEDRARLLEAGFNAFLGKPLRPQMLLEELHNLSRTR